ncbi:MAG: PHP domain-containing protein [Gallintestinimicrobium sp.]
MKKTNYHTHTKRCMHAEGTEADYVKAALNAGLDVLGFSDHGPFPDNRFDSRMPYADLDEYLACMDTAPDRFLPDPERIGNRILP